MLKAINHLFPKVVHPFNLQNDGEKTYAEWQYEKGFDTIRLYMKKFTTDTMFQGKQVLDMGCGAAGKSLYYATLGAEKVTGVDIVAHYETEAVALAEKLHLRDKFEFIRASALTLPFADNTFDTIIMNDFMEHISDPEAALKEGLRLLKTGGKIYINFPPYYHPTGAHLSDAIFVPWAHVFFCESTLLSVYKELIHGLPDEKERLSLRIATDEKGKEFIGYINKMSLKRFRAMLLQLGITPFWYEEIPLRRFLTPLAKFPLTKELFVKMAVCVLEK